MKATLITIAIFIGIGLFFISMWALVENYPEFPYYLAAGVWIIIGTITFAFIFMVVRHLVKEMLK